MSKHVKIPERAKKAKIVEAIKNVVVDSLSVRQVPTIK